MENERLKGADLVPSTQTRRELIPHPTARLVENSLEKDTVQC